ncbi:MAG: shikimate kinase [Sporomusaceae bacterium]|nr:shikimate kinase [Sporomusaceae bacterium]
MPGCGKSSIGLLVSKILQVDFVDLDDYIEEKEHTSIPELFRLGEDHFRQQESTALKEVCQKKAVVISTGGGIVTRAENMLLLRETGTIFYIERSIDMILTSSDFTNRPLLAEDSNKIYTLHKERKHLYENHCHYKIINHQSLDEAAEQIAAIMRDQ